MSLNDEMKKVLLAGIGAVAATYEKSQEVVNTLVKKGEITVEQGKVLNEELKRSAKESSKYKQTGDDGQTDGQQDEENSRQQSLIDQLNQMSEEERAVLRRKLAEMEN